MAETWVVRSEDTSWAQDKWMLTLLNGSGSAKVLRVYRIWVANAQPTAVTGGWQELKLYTISAAAMGGGSALTPVPYHPSNSALDANVVAYTGGTATGVTHFRTIMRDTDEVAGGAAKFSCWTAMVPLSLAWDAGYSSSAIKPLTLRAGEGIGMYAVGSIATGVADIAVEFTHESS